jgi:hypothetical protein
MTAFIFMLTRNDATVANAFDVYEQVRDTGLHYIGFKDVGLPLSDLKDLTATMQADGREVMLEVVSEGVEDELRSIEAAVDLGVDFVLGGTHAAEALDLLAGSGVRYCPFPGTVLGHPSVLRGSVGDIAASARELTAMNGVAGLDLLAYRYDGDVEALVAAVVDAASGPASSSEAVGHACPVIAAGSVDSLERIRTLAGLGVWGFTIGGAVFDGALPGGRGVRDQVVTALRAASTTR